MTVRESEQVDVGELRETFSGQILVPRDEGYDEHRRVWNAMFDRRPSAILRGASVDDVVRVVRFVREQGLPFTVRGGGHNFAGLSIADDAVMIDMSAMNRVEVDAVARTVTAQGGATWGDVDRATAAFGLAVTGGHVPSTGVGGLTLGGGIGWLHGKHGLASDNLLSVEVVTADGKVLTASEHTNADLFWALRGGGGNFGIATSLTFRLHPLSDVLMSLFMYPKSRGVEIFQAYDAFLDTCPNEATTACIMQTAVEDPLFPPDLVGKELAMIFVVWSGDLEAGERVNAPLHDLGPAASMTQATPYVEVQAIGEGMYPAHMLVYAKSGCINKLDGAAKVIADADLGVGALGLLAMGGAIAEREPDATAFGHRNDRYNYVNLGMWDDPSMSEGEIARIRRQWKEIEPFTSGAYVNFLDPNDAQSAQDAYGTAQQQRLAQIKKQYDPDNFFRANVNIKPA